MEREGQEIKDSETLQGDEAAVSRLVAGLERVECPANFERRVMAKIAHGPQPSRRLFGLPAAFAYSLPLLLVLVVAVGYIVSFRKPSQAPVAPIEAGLTRHIGVIDNSSRKDENISQPDNTTVASGDARIVKDPAVSPAPKATVTSPPKKDNEPVGGSFNTTLVERKPLTPLGVGNQNTSANNGNLDGLITSSSLPVREVLSAIGITADFKDGWVVRSITPNNKAERSGVKIGDVIISLGNTILSADTIYKGKVEAGSIRVQRNGTIVDLQLK